MAKKVTPRQLLKVLKYLGFQEIRVAGSHHRFSHNDGRKTTVPIHGNEPIGSGLLNKIIKQDLKITKKEFENLLQN
ncbi:MAG: type II toxin-antitoxin system HicA family toxin [Candidatus Diapherotrites archaeon]